MEGTSAISQQYSGHPYGMTRHSVELQVVFSTAEKTCYGKKRRAGEENLRQRYNVPEKQPSICLNSGA